MTAFLPQQKAELRAKLRTRAAALTEAERRNHSALLCQQLRAQPLWRQAKRVMLFVPRRDEPDIWPLVEESLREGKTVTLPRSVTPEQYEACRIEDPTTDLIMGRYGISEPAPGREPWPLKHLDFVLVPGLGFSLSGGRLGRGKGFYDRLLVHVSGLTCGTAFDWQMTAEVPMEPHDVRLASLVTPTRWYQVVHSARL